METQTQDKKVCKCCGRELTIDHFRTTRWGGVADTCNECINNAKLETKRAKQQQREQARQQAIIEDNATHERLKAFTARQLMQELARRGYVGKLEYTETHIIDITDFLITSNTNNHEQTTFPKRRFRQ